MPTQTRATNHTQKTGPAPVPKTHRHALDGWAWAQCVHTDQKGMARAHTGHMTAHRRGMGACMPTQTRATNHTRKTRPAPVSKTQRHALDVWGWGQCVHTDQKGNMEARTAHMTAYGCGMGAYMPTQTRATNHTQKTRPTPVPKTHRHAEVGAMCSHRPERKDEGPYGPHDSLWVWHGCLHAHTKHVQPTTPTVSTGPKTHRHVLDGWGWAQCVYTYPKKAR